MFKSKRRKELERKENELYRLKMEIEQLKHWCAEDSGEIAFAMLHLESLNDYHQSISSFRDDLRQGLHTFSNYSNKVN